MSLEQTLKDGKDVIVQFYKDGELWYRTPAGAEYPAPITQKGDAAYIVQENRMLFNR